MSLNTLVSYTLILGSTLNARDQVLHPYIAGKKKNSIREEIKNRLIPGMPAIMSSRILSPCLLFKDEVH